MSKRFEVRTYHPGEDIYETQYVMADFMSLEEGGQLAFGDEDGNVIVIFNKEEWQSAKETLVKKGLTV